MKRLYNRHRDSGFTMIEVLIVLAVTLVLFFIATLFISGKQSKVEFTNAVYNLQSELNQTIASVSDATFPNQSFSCTTGNIGMGMGVPNISTGSVALGAHYGCIYLGKLIQFSANNLTIYTIAGNAKYGDNEITSIADPGAEPEISSVISETYGYNNQLKLNYQKYTINGATPPQYNMGGLGLVNNQNSSANYSLETIALNDPPVVPTYSTYPGDVTSYLLTRSTLNPTGGIQLCFDSGVSNQSALLQIGGNNSQKAVQVTIFQNLACV